MKLHEFSRRRLLGCAMGLAPMTSALAQFRLEVVGVGMVQLPIAVLPFKGETAVHPISGIVQADLLRSGQFGSIESSGVQMDETTRLDASLWRQRGADALLSGSLTELADGRFELRARLWDVVRAQERGQFRDTVRPGDLRWSAHRLADWVYEQLTGTPGAFASRISYITKSSGRFHLWVADADGEGALNALTSPEPLISPSWSPDGTRLAYVSFETRKPVVYVHELATGKRQAVANFRGSNSAPTWSPDGRYLVATLSRDGGSQLFRIELATGQLLRLTQSTAIDTEPAYSPDGQQLYFVSDRGGSPQVYRMNATGGPAERITFSGSYNISPSPSPDGRSLAYITRQGGEFKLMLQSLESGQVTALTQSRADERPSFAPNSRAIVYATIDQGREALMTVSVDGKVRTRLAGRAGDIRQPAWGPVRR